MFGIIIALIATFFNEIATSIGKSRVLAKAESIYTMGFLNLFWATIFFLLYAYLVSGEFIFLLASLPTFGVRLVLEVVQAHVTVRAIAIADRSTFGFLRIITIPLLLFVDVALGYTLTMPQIVGISLIVVSFLILFAHGGLRWKGAGLVLFTAVNAVVTISLFKYNITNFNSVEAEQSIISIVLMGYFYLMARFYTKERPFSYLAKPVFFAQSFAMGIGSALLPFAYLFAPASVITSAKRVGAILVSTLSGNIYFKEKRFAVKLVAFTLMAASIVLLTR